MNISKSDAAAIDKLVQSTISSWIRYHEHVPSVLYHYTSAEGLIGILSSQSLWMTELRYMNDLSELQYSRELIKKRLELGQERENLSEVQKEFLKRISSSFDPFVGGNAVFSISFCEEGNLLSRWRAYRGKGGGYAIGFDFFHLLRFTKQTFRFTKGDLRSNRAKQTYRYND